MYDLRRKIASAVAIVLIASSDAAAQAPDRLTVLEEPGTPVVAVSIWIDTGDAPGDSLEAGLAALAARSIHAPIQDRLDDQGAHIEVDIQHAGVLFTLLAAPDHWDLALHELGLALFRDPPDRDVVERARARLIREIRSVEPNPARQAEMWTDRKVVGPDHPWRHPPLGYRATLERFTADDVDRFLRQFFVADRALFAVVGPVAESRAQEVVSPFLSPDPYLPDGPPPAAEPAVHRIDYPTITSWVTVVYPMEMGADVVALEHLAGAAADALAYGPRRRSIYSARAWVVHRPGRPELRIEVVVPPRETDQWAEHVQSVAREHASDTLTRAEVERTLRRQNGRLALAGMHPEARARAAIQRAIMGTGTLDISEGMTAERLRSVAATLPEPVVVKLGPFESASD